MAGCRTGKTRPVLEFLRGVENVLVLTKKTAVVGWWSEMDLMGIDGATWVVTNYEQIRTVGWDMSRKWGALVCDEAHTMATFPKPNQMAPIVAKLAILGPRIGLTATPCAESYSQLFHQAKALKWPIWTEFKNFYAWHKVYGIPDPFRAHGRTLESYKKVKPLAWEEFKQFCVIVDRQEVMPDFVEAQEHLVRIEAPEVLEMCQKLKRDGVLYVEGRAVVADSPLALAQKCQQITAGVVLDDQGQALQVNTVKRDWVLGKFAGACVAILTQFRAEVGLYGGTDDREAWIGNGGMFVGNIQRFARGVDLSKAEALVLTGCPWSAEAHQQAKDRILRQDRVRPAPVYFPVIAGGIDEMIYQRVAIEKAFFTARLYR